MRVILSGATSGSFSCFFFFFSLQAVTSFVRALQLGGKGYAPAESDPLRKHVKGLSDFVQFVDNLEEILGEIPDPRYTELFDPGFHLLPVLLLSLTYASTVETELNVGKLRCTLSPELEILCFLKN